MPKTETHELEFVRGRQAIEGERVGHFLVFTIPEREGLHLVSHIASGQGVYADGFPNHRRAVNFAKALNAIDAPWAEIKKLGDQASLPQPTLDAIMSVYRAETDRRRK